MNPVLRPARPDEAAALSALALRSKAHWGYDAAFLEACAAELTLHPDEIEHASTHLIEIAGTLAGFYSLERIDDESVDLNHLFVDPPYIGTGLGRRLLLHAAQRARALGYRQLVIQGDPNALRFYRTMGARLVGMRPSESIPGRELPELVLELGEA